MIQTTQRWRTTIEDQRSTFNRCGTDPRDLMTKGHRSTRMDPTGGKIATEHLSLAVERAEKDVARARCRAMVADGVVEDHGYQDRDHSDPDLHHTFRTSCGFYQHR